MDLRVSRRRTASRAVHVAVILVLGAVGTVPQSRAADDGDSLERLQALVADMPAGTWRQLPGRPADILLTEAEAQRIAEDGEKLLNHLQDLATKATSKRRGPGALGRLWGKAGPEEIVRGPSGAAFDGRRIYLFGGRDPRYRGNDIVTYDLVRLRWQRLYDPAFVTTETYGADWSFVPRQGPRAVPVYDGLVYDREGRALYLWGKGARTPWKFDITVFDQTKDPWQAWSQLAWPPEFRPDKQATAQRGDGRILLLASRRGPKAVVFDPKSGRYGKVQTAKIRAASLVWRPVDGLAYMVQRRQIAAFDGNGRLVARTVTRIPIGFYRNPESAGMVWDSRHDRLVFWSGGSDIWTYDFADRRWRQYANPAPPEPAPVPDGVWSRWFYVAAVDAFIGLTNAREGAWLYKLPQAEPGPHPLRAKLAAQGFLCSDAVQGWSCPSLQDQVKAGLVQKGDYIQCATVRRRVDFQGSRIHSKICRSKAALIAQDGAVIENAEIYDISIRLNGACIRWEGGDLTVRNVHCHDTDMGLLGKGRRLVIEDSLFESTLNDGRNWGHVIYAAEAEEVIIRNSTIRDPGHEGHVVKTGARHTRIEKSVLAGGSRPYSRVLDAFNGGFVEIIDSRIAAGPDGGNTDLIGFGSEMRRRFEDNRIVVDGAELDCSAALVRNTVHVWPDRVGSVAIDWRPALVKNCPLGKIKHWFVPAP